MAGLATATVLATGDEHACAVVAAGTVQCWGANNYGQLGNGSSKPAAAPVAAIELNSAVAVSAGFAHGCALSSDDRVHCWGRNESGQLGNGTKTSSDRPKAVSASFGAK